MEESKRSSDHKERKPRKSVSKEDIKKMIDMKKTKITNVEIAEQLDYSPRTIRVNLKEYMPDYDNYKQNKKITEKDVKEMIRMKKQGKTNETISEIIGCDAGTVGRHLQENLNDYESFKLDKKISEEDIKEMITLKREGKTNDEISNEFDCCSAHVGRILKNEMEDYQENKQDYHKHIKEEERIFLKKHGIDIDSLESRWNWIKENVKLVKRYYRDVVFKYYGRIPAPSEIDNEFGGFRNVVKSQLNQTIKELQNESGHGKYFNREEILEYFSNKRSLESLLIKNLSLVLNFGIPDISSEVFHSGAYLKPQLIAFELSKNKKKYSGFKERKILGINKFLQNLPEGDELEDEFSILMRKRKETAIDIFSRYRKLRKAYRGYYRRKRSSNTFDNTIFDWNRDNYNKLGMRLNSEIESILKANISNEFPFNAISKHNPRSSKFSIRGSYRAQIKSTELEEHIDLLHREKKIIINSPIGLRLVNHAKELEKISKNKKIFRRQDGLIMHGPLQSYILQNEKSAIAKELFVWKELKNYKKASHLTGHIDLLLADNKFYCCDYKPKGNFFKTLPQVCAYGLILIEMLKLDPKLVRCVSFNNNEAWEYNPLILLDDISRIVAELKKNHPTLNNNWENIFKK